MGTGSFPGVKRPSRGVHHAPPSSAEVKERVELHPYSRSGPSWPVIGWNLIFFLPLPPNTFPWRYLQSGNDGCLPRSFHFIIHQPAIPHYTGWFRRKRQYFGRWQYRLLCEENHTNMCLILIGDRDRAVSICSLNVLFVGFDGVGSLQNKFGHTRRVARSHSGCCCSHKEKWRSTQTNNTRFSHTRCEVL